MRLAAKVLAGVAIALLVLFGIVAAIIATIDPRTLLAPIEAELGRATGRAVSLGTQASISLSLTPKITLTDVTLGNAPWGSVKEMIRAKRVEAEVALLPLLSRRVDILRFTLFEPVIVLETDKEGRGNWVFGESAPSPVRPSDPLADAVGAFGLGEFAVERGDVRWRDGRSGEQTAIRVDRLYLRARDPGKPVVAEFSGAIGEVPLAFEGHFGPLAALLAKQWPWPVSVKGEVAGRKTEVTTKLQATPDGIEASDLSLDVGNAKVRGSLTYVSGGPRPLIRFKLEADTLTPADLVLAGGAVARGTEIRSVPAAKPDGRLFAAIPVRLDGIRAVDAKGELAIGKLVLSEGRMLTAVRARIDLVDGRLDVPELRANFAGGSVQGRLVVDARNVAKPAIALRFNARELDLAALMTLAGASREVRGGKTELEIDLNARGDSPRDWATSLSGSAIAKVGRASWVSSNAGIAPELHALLDALNPLRGTDPNTVLDCAAVRLPFANGVARVDRGIAFETDRLAGSASGTIDLRNESLELSVSPRAKSTAGVDLAKLAGAVRIRGPIAQPRVEVDPAGSIAAAAEVAVLARGGGKALLAGLLAPPSKSASSGGECAYALAGVRSAPETVRAAGARAKPAPADPAQDLGRALGKLLGR